MALAAFVAGVGQNLGLLELNPTMTTVMGLVLGEISKYLNTKSKA